MNSYERLKVAVLRATKAANDYYPIRVHELATQYGLNQRHVQEKLEQMHAEKLIKLCAWNEQEGRELSIDEWPAGRESFFLYASDGNYKRVHLLVHGAEWLEERESIEGFSVESNIPTPLNATTANGQGTQQSHGWEEVRSLGEGGQSKVTLVRSPSRVAGRAKALEDIRIAYHAGGTQFPLLATAIWEYSRPDDISELGAMKRFKIRTGGALAEQRLKREIGILRESRPGLPRLLDANEDEQWMVTEFFPGKTLADFPARYAGRPREALKAFRTLVETVAQSLHKDSFVHRDIKPANVFISADDMLVPGDFGIIFVPGQHTRVTVLDERVGPWEYMPPWAVTGTRFDEVQPNFDVYMLGKLLWCMVSGRQWLSREEHREPEYNLEKSFPEDRNMRLINSLLDKCLARRPEGCLQSAGQLLFRVKCAAADSVRKIPTNFPP